MCDIYSNLFFKHFLKDTTATVLMHTTARRGLWTALRLGASEQPKRLRFSRFPVTFVLGPYVDVSELDLHIIPPTDEVFSMKEGICRTLTTVAAPALCRFHEREQRTCSTSCQYCIMCLCQDAIVAGASYIARAQGSSYPRVTHHLSQALPLQKIS